MTPATQLQHLESEVARLRAKVRRLQIRTKRLGNERDEEKARRLAVEARLAAMTSGQVSPLALAQRSGLGR